MEISFEKNAYYKAVTNDKNFNSEFKILDKANKELKFHYGSATRKEFNNDYSPKGWVERKFKCIPAALMCGLVKTTYHLTQAIFIGVIISPFDGGKYFLAKTFSFVQDVKQSGGWLATLFNDQFGQFYVEESAFQKTCYARHLSKTALVEKEALSQCRVSYKEFNEVESHLKAGENDKALTALKQWPITEEKNAYFIKLFQAFITKKEFERAASMLSEIPKKEQKANIKLLANESFTAWGLDKAKQLADELALTHQNQFIVNLAQSCVASGENAKALELLNDFHVDWNGDNNYYILNDIKKLVLEITNDYLKVKDLDNALKALEIIKLFNNGLESEEAGILFSIVQQYAQNNDEMGVLKTLRLLVIRSRKIHNLNQNNQNCLLLPRNITGIKTYPSKWIFKSLVDHIVSQVNNEGVVEIKLGDSFINLRDVNQEKIIQAKVLMCAKLGAEIMGLDKKEDQDRQKESYMQNLERMSTNASN